MAVPLAAVAKPIVTSIKALREKGKGGEDRAAQPLSRRNCGTDGRVMLRAFKERDAAIGEVEGEIPKKRQFK